MCCSTTKTHHPSSSSINITTTVVYTSCKLVTILILGLLVFMSNSSDAASPNLPRGKQNHNNALFLRNIPQESSISRNNGYHPNGGGPSSDYNHGHHHAHHRSVERALHTHNNGHREEHLLQDAEDVKVRPLQGKAALIGRTRVWLRRAVDAVWPLSPSTSSPSLSTSSSSNVAALGGGGGGGGNGGGGSPPKGYMHWRATTQDMLALSGSGGGGSGSGKMMGTRYTASKPTAAYYHHYYHNPHAHQGLKVGPLLAARQNVGDVGGGGDGSGGSSSSSSNMNINNNNYNLSPQPYQPQHHKAPSALDKISINMTMPVGDMSCPVELIAPCAVPSASLKDQGILREEGLIVPSSFLVGDVVDFVTRMSKLDRYSAASSSKNTTCRSLERIFVTDCGKLMGYVTSMDLLVHDRHSPLLSIVRPCEVIVKESDEYDDAIIAMRTKGLTYAPVVSDHDNVVTGIITPTDMLNEMEMEATDDVSRFSGSGGGESYFGTPLVQLVTARAWWLISLLMLQSLSSIILTHFSSLIERHLVIALFLTMLTGTAGNAGNQSSAMVIRGLATGEINRRNGWKVVMRELKAAFFMSILLAGASFIRVYITPGSTLMSTIAVTLAMSVTVVGACFMGTFAPLVLDRLGLDPCNCASPALATMTDVGGVLILCAISSAMLG